MVQRLCKLSKTNSFFLFGARGTGKSTLLKSVPFLKDSLYIDLLNPETEDSYALAPERLGRELEAKESSQWVIIDEVQKLPRLLDVVHSLIEKRKTKFALTGSSSRKLKSGGGNLLAGRAFLFSLFPFTSKELGEAFNLEEALAWGTLPKMSELSDTEDRARFLRTYTQVYLKEEILVEQLIRNLDPFRLFLPMAGQTNGHIVNYSNIAKETGVDHKTVQNYYQILADTYLGFFLEAYSRSVRKVQKQSPKFYFFDMGIKRAIEKRLTVPLQERTSEFGDAFESWFINECFRLNSYNELDYSFSYLRTKDDVEIDLIVERPGTSPALVEIKSSDSIDERHLRSLIHFAKDFPKADLICACRIPRPQKFDRVWALPWKDALKAIGLS